jgi:hypothetical protein
MKKPVVNNLVTLSLFKKYLKGDWAGLCHAVADHKVPHVELLYHVLEPMEQDQTNIVQSPSKST